LARVFALRLVRVPAGFQTRGIQSL
jgi:hypothetical protein